MTESEMAESLAYAAVAAGKDLTREVVIVYHDQLKNHAKLDVDNAVRACIREKSGFPTVAAIREQLRIQHGMAVDRSLEHTKRVIGAAQEARRLGWSPDSVAALIEKLDRKHVSIIEP